MEYIPAYLSKNDGLRDERKPRSTPRREAGPRAGSKITLIEINTQESDI